jgi:DNA-binding MarR family transcriptional regulator
VLAALTSIVRAIRRHVDPHLDRGQHLLLRTLQLQPGQRATELADSCALDPSTVSRHLRQLEEEGRVRREADPADGRAHLLFLTPAGEHVVAAANAQQRRLLLDPLNHWDVADVARLAELLTRLADDVSAPAPEADQAPAPGVPTPGAARD